MSLCKHVFMYVCMVKQEYDWPGAFTFRCMSVSMYLCIYVCVYAVQQTGKVHLCVVAWVHLYVCVYGQTGVCYATECGQVHLRFVA
jgi:hypothetical protein